ncbi:MAG: Uma2 family endonuclease [Anaerolineae bacterium]|jgi:Uma2 family endonuclease|nr:Uma2 family endonuclease [Anaerolineae bacterium]
MLAPTLDKTRLSLEAFLALPETQTPTELFDGEMIVSPAPSYRHQKLLTRLYDLLKRLAPAGGEVLFAPIDVILGPGTVAQPDVLWIAPDSPRCTERDGRLYGPPDLCVEVLSPSTARLDRTVKFTAYESAGVREYWVVEPTTETVEVWVLKEGEFNQQGVYRADQTFASPVLAAESVPVAEVFAPPST